MEILFFGLGLWNVNYLYVWLILAVAAYLLRRMESPLGWAMVSGVFGLLFGALCGIVDIFIGGFTYALTKWTSGLLFDIYHCVGNFVIALLLFMPLRNLLEKLCAKLQR
jgi:energy-coupling factor transport system substrate-specific component